MGRKVSKGEQRIFYTFFRIPPLFHGIYGLMMKNVLQYRYLFAERRGGIYEKEKISGSDDSGSDIYRSGAAVEFGEKVVELVDQERGMSDRGEGFRMAKTRI